MHYFALMQEIQQQCRFEVEEIHLTISRQTDH